MKRDQKPKRLKLCKENTLFHRLLLLGLEPSDRYMSRRTVAKLPTAKRRSASLFFSSLWPIVGSRSKNEFSFTYWAQTCKTTSRRIFPFWNQTRTRSFLFSFLFSYTVPKKIGQAKHRAKTTRSDRFFG